MACKSRIALQLLLEVFPAGLSLLIFVIIVPVIIIALIAIQLYQWGLILYVKVLKKDIIRVMAGNNPIMAIEDSMYTRPLCVIVGYGAFEGATVELLTQLASNSILQTDSTTGELQYPETHQFYEEWKGYIWWKWEKNFKLENHISIWNDGRDKQNPVLEKDFIKIVATLEARPFIRERSPWDIVIVENILLHNVKDPEIPKAGIIFRVQHGLADGLSLLKLCMKNVFTDKMEKIRSPEFQQSSAMEKVFQLGTILKLPYQFAKQMLFSFDRNEWHIKEAKLSREIYRSWTRRIPISLIKDFKNGNEVGFTSVLIFVVTGALRKMLIKHNVKVPKQMHAVVPLPWPNHPKNLCNHWSFGFLVLPTGQKDDLRRLRHVHRCIEGMKISLLPAFNFYVTTLVNKLPTWILKYVNVVPYMPTLLISNLPGPPPESTGLGCNLVDSMFTGTFPGSLGINICIVSYDNAVRIALGVDSAIFRTQEMTDDLIEILENEFFELKKLNKLMNSV